jgi:hypothetical protein
VRAPTVGGVRHAVRLVPLLLALACTRGTSVSSPEAPAASPLPDGKFDLRLHAARWRSPDGFAPVLSFELGEGWQSVHRYPDFFDIGKPEPGHDAPRVAVAFSIAEKDDADAVVDDVVYAGHRRFGPPQTTTLAGRPATLLDARGGSGPVYSSGNLGLDLSPKQGLTLYVVQLDARVLVVAIIVPDVARWEGERYAAEAMLRTLVV